MRNLSKNQTKLYLVRPSTITDATDISGNYTGETVVNYSAVATIYVCLMPVNGSILRNLKGDVSNFDKSVTDVNKVLRAGDLLFYVSPSANYAITYDYSVDSILDSLTSSTCILKARL